MKNVRTIPSPYRVQWIDASTFDKQALMYGLQKQFDTDECRILDLVILGRVELELAQVFYALVLSVWYASADSVVPLRLDVSDTEINRYIETGLLAGDPPTNMAA